MSDEWAPDFGALSRTPPAWAPKRPVRIAVLGDFSAGAAAGRLETGAALAKRKMISVEFDTLEDALARLQVELTLPIGQEGEGVQLSFADLDAFHPDTLYRELGVFKALADLRKRLNNTATFAKAAAEVQSWGGGALRPASRSGRRRARSAAPAAGGRLDDFARLVGVAPELRTDGPIDALLKRVVGPFVQRAPDPKRDPLVAAVDSALADAMRAVLHQPEFQNLESLWRGMDLLLRRIETGPMLQVLLVDVSAEEFAADLSSAGDLADSGLYSMLVDKPSQEKNGGVSLICGLYQFEATPPHTELLGRMARIAAHAGAPFVTAMNGEGFTDRRAEIHPLVQEAMDALRSQPESPFLGLLWPRFLLRYPYGKRSDPISAFAFEEFTAADGLRGMLWGHPAIVAACLLAAPTGRTMSLGDLPFHYVVDADGDQVALPCTERLVGVDAAARLRGLGIGALMAHKGQPELRLNGLDAVDGSALGIGMGKPAPKPGVSTTLRGKVGEVGTNHVASPAWQPAASPAVRAAAGSDDEDDVQAVVASDDAASEDSEAAPEASSEPSLDDLLASLGGADDAPMEAAAEEAAGDDADMDPELAALLKSLEG